LPLGYSNLEIINNKNGKPCDFEILEVNAAFGQIMYFINRYRHKDGSCRDLEWTSQSDNVPGVKERPGNLLG